MKFYKIILKYLFMQIGAFLAAVAIEEFLIPNNIIDGGIVGISIIISYLSKIPLGFFIVVLNIPFVLFGYKHLGKDFVISTVYSVISLSIWVSVLHPIPELTKDLFLASIFGGIILGLGVGLIIRNGGSLDGTEIVAIILNRKVSFSVGEIVMFINVFIFFIAGIVFGLDRAMYSMVTYFIAFKMIDIVVEGIDDSKAIFIISNESEQIKDKLASYFNRGLTIFDGRGGYSNEKKDILYIIIRRSEIYRLKNIVLELDKEAFITIQDIKEVFGKNIDEWKNHKK
jgi:uncharacterized membrane-anchored protein YitT (DUF2179 family)